MKKFNVSIGKLVRKARVKNNLTQQELANRLGYESVQFVSVFERGHSKVPHIIIGKMVVILGLNEKKFFDLIVKEYKKELVATLNAGKTSMLVKPRVKTPKKNNTNVTPESAQEPEGFQDAA
ncbi:MAG: helix-turn-helix transcriptional regulator [Bdellovibrionota bacterium]